MNGSLYLVGLGPGSPEHLTIRAAEVLRSSEAVVGYGPYVNLVAAWFPSDTRRYVRGVLGRETERAAEAVRLARTGLRVALVSGGDAAIYGMAGPLFELLAAQGWSDACPDPPVEVVPGVTAALAANAMLGAPLADDVALISLSDVVAPWPLIAARVEAAARGDFVLALYNPASAQRQAGIREVRQILLRHRPPSTPVALVRNALRAGSNVTLTSLGRFLEGEQPIDMATLVLVGNRQTTQVGRRLLAHRASTAPSGIGSAAPVHKTSASPALRASALPSHRAEAASSNRTSAAPTREASAAPARRSEAAPWRRGDAAATRCVPQGNVE
jgi:precorrin-3B C17-methyltransferase